MPQDLVYQVSFKLVAYITDNQKKIPEGKTGTSPFCPKHVYPIMPQRVHLPAAVVRKHNN
ncbi:hypothetical protein QTP88_012153 [Uroleucon formosanum]